MFCCIHLRAIPQVLMHLICNMCSEITLLKLLPHLPGINELSYVWLHGKCTPKAWSWLIFESKFNDFPVKKMVLKVCSGFNSSPPGQNGRHFGRCIFLDENDKISIQISLKLVPKSPIDNKPALVQVMAWWRKGDKPLPEPMMYWGEMSLKSQNVTVYLCYLPVVTLAWLAIGVTVSLSVFVLTMIT